ncbi:helicase C-terminal domain-containing protein [Fusobacterium sp.]|uniref:ATP-dependent DNA helicase n=2 Tax=Fusobacterium sp. TaxID=68766 RepID=UPI002609AFC1|nr:helicase C-terminal domain-containing protein [Fusobacterium sp.]
MLFRKERNNMDINLRITSEIQQEMKKEIEEAGGNEVFFRGILDEEKRISKIIVVARGNKYSVPAILGRMKREEVIIHNHPSGYLYPSDADIEVATVYANKMNGGFYIINNKVDDVYVVIEPYNEENQKIDIVPYFEEEGIISQNFKEFEFREEQLSMARHIQEGINQEKKIIVEAGTGTGKTLAYLIPSIEWAVTNEKRVIISTNTINLQEQLLNKDIPMLQKIMEKKFKYALVKGRGNYLCNRKYFNVKSGKNKEILEFSPEQKNQLIEILNWGKETNTGDKSELNIEPDYTVWELFQSESDLCFSGCPHREECFFFKARDEKKRADILIANHHIFFSDLAIKKEIGFSSDYSILPEYGMVVFDEAHNVEKVARDYFSYEVSRYSFVKSMNKILNVSKLKDENINSDIKLFETNEKIKVIGQLKDIISIIEKTDFDEKSELEDIIDKDFIKEHISLFNYGIKYFERLIEIFSKGQNGNISVRIKKDDIATDGFLKLLDDFRENFNLEFTRYLRTAKKIKDILSDVEDASGKINEFLKYIERIESFYENFQFINKFEDEEFIYWVEVNERKNNSKLVATPLKVDMELSENLYDNLKQIIFTSATLSVSENFEYFKKSIGLLEETYDKIIKSPFDYDKQMKVYIPKGLPDPNSREFADYIQEIIKVFLEKTGGRTFVLFTSYKMLNYVYYSMREELEESGITLFIQGMYPRTKMVEIFKKSKAPVLFGTDSFWEGVDVKGDQLSSVIIVKLPFKVPSDPVTEAIIETFEQEGKNSFLEYQIPESIIKFKQGIGRLIRSKEDKGIITILDNRVITKTYGKYFLESIPTKNISRIDVEDILRSGGKNEKI